MKISTIFSSFIRTVSDFWKFYSQVLITHQTRNFLAWWVRPNFANFSPILQFFANKFAHKSWLDIHLKSYAYRSVESFKVSRFLMDTLRPFFQLWTYLKRIFYDTRLKYQVIGLFEIFQLAIAYETVEANIRYWRWKWIKRNSHLGMLWNWGKVILDIFKR